MTTRKTFKKRVRDRQEKHGETYSTARMHVTNAASSTVEARKAFRRMADRADARRTDYLPSATTARRVGHDEHGAHGEGHEAVS